MMMVYYCFSQEKILEKIKAEIKEHIKCEDDISFETLKKMDYLECLFL